MVLSLVVLICFVLAGVLLWKARQEHKKQKEEKSLLVILGGLIFVFLFPGLALAIIGVVCLLMLLGVF